MNKPEYINDAYQRFIINRFRELLPFSEVPINLVVRARERKAGMAPTLDEAPVDPTGETTTPQAVRPVKLRPQRRKMPGQRPHKKRQARN